MHIATRLVACGLALAGWLFAGRAIAAIALDGGPTMTPFGGGGWSGGSGNIGTGTGLTWDYSGLDLSQSAHLYWGLSNQDLYPVSPPTGLSLGPDGLISGSELFGASDFSRLSATKAVWSGTSSLRDYQGGTLHIHSDVKTRLTITVTGTGDWVVDDSLNTGFAYTEALWEITGGTSFSVTLLAEFFNPHTNSWVPYLTGYDSLTSPPDTPTVSVTAGWYYEENPIPSGDVPEPSTLLIWSLLGAVGASSRWLRKRRVA